ncbi:MAG TPA: MaoC family dehydratase [Rhizomicrobium sp.]|jgi:3-hydroxybutyryl-CoA dehydratase|nr:MaoC family dehydratase [Rhizomicrobium sp.]
MTYYLDQLIPGLSESASHTVTERDIELFGEATGDRNPVHFDEAFARRTIFRGRVAHGALSIGFISGVIGTQLPGNGTILKSASISFKEPVRIGETVTTTVTVQAVEGREAVLDCVCKVGEREVIESRVRVLAPKRPSAKAPA